jgi:hypothetical protein
MSATMLAALTVHSMVVTTAALKEPLSAVQRAVHLAVQRAVQTVHYSAEPKVAAWVGLKVATMARPSADPMALMRAPNSAEPMVFHLAAQMALQKAHYSAYT